MFCYNCGSRVDDNAQFCAKCGMNLKTKNIENQEINEYYIDETEQDFCQLSIIPHKVKKDINICIDNVDYKIKRRSQKQINRIITPELHTLRASVYPINMSNQLSAAGTFADDVGGFFGWGGVTFGFVTNIALKISSWWHEYKGYTKTYVIDGKNRDSIILKISSSSNDKITIEEME